jgi:DNA-binding NtrC family response regulator
MPVISISAKDAKLHQIVRTLLPEYTIGGEGRPDLLIAELSGERDCPGAKAIRKLRETHPALHVVVISGGSSPAVTQQAVRLRVDDFFTLPAERAEFRDSVVALVAGRQAPAKNFEQQNGLLGNSPNMVALRKYVARVALTDSSVLIMGETGTGKELVAELIHKGGPRRDKPFVAVNAAAVPDTLLESELFGYERGAFTGAYVRHQGKLRQAHGGTIFFDEIGDIGLSAQAKLLRAIESREVHPLGGCRGTSVDIRLIAATNRDLGAMVRAREFRQDLFYRLDVVRIEMPPLRDNREDIPQLLAHFVETFNRRFRRKVRGFRADAAELLAGYDWPGNIRQLRNLVESCFVNTASDLIEVKDLPVHFRLELESKLDPQSRESLLQALQASNWNISRVAWQLQCSRMTVYRKMAHFRVSRGGDKAVSGGRAGSARR